MHVAFIPDIESRSFNHLVWGSIEFLKWDSPYGKKEAENVPKGEPTNNDNLVAISYGLQN